MSKIIVKAIEEYRPVAVLLLFSGGHDSLCSTHYAATVLKSIDVPFTVYHGNTGIGIPETLAFVKIVCETYKWRLHVQDAPVDAYERYVKAFGFPGPSHHPIMYRNLKEKPLRKYASRLKTSLMARENVLLITGIRQSESKIRMGYKHSVHKDETRIWCSPLFDWSTQDCEKYMSDNALPRNPVKDKMCISGECLCGAFGGHEEWIELKANYPQVAERIENLHQKAIENGKPWHWSQNPNIHKKLYPNGIANNMFMCVGCEEKNTL